MQGTYTHPFSDVPGWADRYVAYAYKNGLTHGISSKKFGSANITSSAQFITFVLRTPGYNDNAGDFIWSESILKAADIGLIDKNSYTGGNTIFLRDDCVKISFNALSIKKKDQIKTLLDSLVETGAVSRQAAISVGLSNALAPLPTIAPTSIQTHAPDNNDKEELNAWHGAFYTPCSITNPDERYTIISPYHGSFYEIYLQQAPSFHYDIQRCDTHPVQLSSYPALHLHIEPLHCQDLMIFPTAFPRPSGYGQGFAQQYKNPP